MASEKDDAPPPSEDVVENVVEEVKDGEVEIEPKMNDDAMEGNDVDREHEEDLGEEDARDQDPRHDDDREDVEDTRAKDADMGGDDIGNGKPDKNDNEGSNNDARDAKENNNERATGEECELDINEEGDPQKAGSLPEQSIGPESPQELEEDSPEDNRPKLATRVGWSDSTLNVMPTCEGKLLMTLCEGGFQYLLAAARGDTAVKSGRYLFEVKIVEVRLPVEQAGGKGSQQIPQQLLRLGFTDSKSSLFISDEDGSIGFDSEGGFITSKSKKYFTKRFQPYEVFGILLNLDPESPNCNTVSLFRDGTRVCEPKQIPDSMKGKALFPTVNYRNMTVHVNFGPAPLAPLPFKCHMIQDAAEVDVLVDKSRVSDQCEVVLPIGLPDEGTFDWLDGFLKENPDYVEVSDRAILEWARKSGLVRPRGFSQRACNDRPGMDFGIREMDDLSVRRLIRSVAPVLRRKYVIMEVRNNLLVAQRKKVLEHFHSDFKKIAIVAMGEPAEQHKHEVQQTLVEKKREKARSEAKIEFDKCQAAKASESTEEKKPDEGDDNGREGKPEDTLDEVLARADKIELSDEERNIWFRKPTTNDLTTKDLANSFVNFSLPTQCEGFDEIKYTWQQEDRCCQYMKEWIAEQKLTQKVEDLQPGLWFQEQMREWQSLSSSWHKAQGDFLDSQRNKPRKAKDDIVKGSADVDAETKDEEEKKEEESKEESKIDVCAEVNVADIDAFLVEDICDAGNKEPLFAHFAFEDWEMLKLRFEIHALVHSFRRDLNDVERPSFHESHLPFYYHKYYKNNFSVKKYGVNSVTELVDLISDTIEVVSKNSILEPQLSDDTPLENFVRLTEDERRRRQRRLDSGCESAALKVQRAPPTASTGRGYNNQRQPQRGGYNQQSRDGGGYHQTSRGAIGAGSGNSGRAPPGNNSRPPPTSRAPPHSSGYSSNAGSRSGGCGGSGGSSYGNNHGGSSRGGSAYGGYGGSGGSRSYGSGAAPPSRGYGMTAPAPPARSYGGSSQSGAQKRPYPSSSSNPPPSKYPRGSGSGSFGSSTGSGSRSYGSSSGGGHGGSSYRR